MVHPLTLQPSLRNLPKLWRWDLCYFNVSLREDLIEPVFSFTQSHVVDVMGFWTFSCKVLGFSALSTDVECSQSGQGWGPQNWKGQLIIRNGCQGAVSTVEGPIRYLVDIKNVCSMVPP